MPFVICSNIIVKGITITAPIKSPNTDGINPGLLFIMLLQFLAFTSPPLLCSGTNMVSHETGPVLSFDAYKLNTYILVFIGLI